MDAFFNPKNVAVIGASRTPGKIGHVIMQNFTGGKFKGNIFPINPEADMIFGFQCYNSIKDVKAQIDLAVICVKADIVEKVFLECCNKKVKAVVIVSAGFNEIGNYKLAEKLQKLIDKHKSGTRVVGPNCLGILNCANGVDTLFLPRYKLERPKKGGVSFISQSGAVGSATLDWASMMGYGVGKFISYGNAFDVDESDLVEYLVEDKETKVIVMYVEGIKNGRRFFEVAKKYARKKPIILLKGGKTAAGMNAAKSHTASIAGNYAAYKAVCRQTGIIEAENMQELFDFARVFSSLQKPKGMRVQIITDGGGYGVLAADDVQENGLILAKMQEKNVNEIRKMMPSYVVLSNPMDLTGDANNQRYKAAVEEAMKDSNIDIIVVIILYQVPTLTSEIIETITELNRKSTKPLIAISLGGEFSEMHKRAMEREGVVNFTYPHTAMKSLKALCDFYLKK